VPPANKPLPAEINACNRFLAAAIGEMGRLRVILSLGTVSHDAVLRARGMRVAQHRFGHGAMHALPGGVVLADSYHVSRYNTSTRRLTAAMFERVVASIRELIENA
jgi:uracil-DNA glycosylase